MLRVPTDTSNQADWNRKAANAINQLIGKRLVITAKTATYTVEDGVDVVTGDTTGGAFSITLPKAALHSGRLLVIKRINAGANNLTIDGDGAETIDGAATVALTTQWETRTLTSNGTAWLVL